MKILDSLFYCIIFSDQSGEIDSKGERELKGSSPDNIGVFAIEKKTSTEFPK